MPRTAKTPEGIKKKPEKEFLIQRSMRVSDILTLLPNAASLLAEYGLSCFHCSANSIETLEEGALSHGFADDVIDDLVTDLNELLKNKPERPQTLTLTEAGANALKEIMLAEGKADHGLLVGLDESGGFCMEFQKDAERDDQVFQNATVPDVRIFATSMTLSSIGGSTIDFRDRRFKLDLPEDASKKGCACESGGGCECGH